MRGRNIVYVISRLLGLFVLSWESVRSWHVVYLPIWALMAVNMYWVVAMTGLLKTKHDPFTGRDNFVD